MNKEALLYVAAALDKVEHMKALRFRFKMSEVLERDDDDCGTAGCIVGMAVVLLGTVGIDKDGVTTKNIEGHFEQATRLFGLDSDEQMTALVDPKIYNEDFELDTLPMLGSKSYTPGRAARAIRYFVNGYRNPWVTVFKEDKVI